MPEQQIEFEVTSDAGVIAKTVPTKRLVEISLRAPQAAARAARPAFNLALII